ncbi:CbtB-domain containing protein [Prescottella sp. R16]|uniref:CbtB domain-containing protein n=1 Tax=Prescottella sp. R16 TaxID=3064529 RepID=UPI00272DE0F6|nr:CbtB-domain containing protein [Prescottella sp. R16]
MTLVHGPDRAIESIGIALVAVGVVLLALLALYLVGFDQGAVSRTGMYMHELMHDGRHLMGLPCH